MVDVKGEVYNAVLGLVDITRGTNSYYKLQVLKEDKRERFVLENASRPLGLGIELALGLVRVELGLGKNCG